MQRVKAPDKQAFSKENGLARRKANHRVGSRDFCVSNPRDGRATRVSGVNETTAPLVATDSEAGFGPA